MITEGTEGEIESRTRRRKKVSTGWMDGWTGKRKKTIPPLFQRRNFAVEDGNKKKKNERKSS